MHYCILLFTKSLPSDADIVTTIVKEVYRDYSERGGFITVLDLHD